MKEWYLIDRPSLTSGGFENESFNDYKDDAICEILDTELASTVELCNHDLTVRKKVRCVVQDNTADTQLNSMARTLLFPIGTVKAGMYVFFEDCYWLLTGYPGNNKVYEKVTAVLCQYCLRWQNSLGQIVERWVNLASASKYDVGEGGNKNIYLTSNNLSILVPNDEESMMLEGMRVFVDQRDVNPTRVFKITRLDDSLYFYGNHGSVLSLIADKTEFNENTDNQKLKICDYYAQPTKDSFGDIKDYPEQTYPNFRIVHNGNPTIISGGNAKTFSVVFEDENCTCVPEWSVITLPENEDYISSTVNKDRSITLKCTYESSIVGTKVMLVAAVGNKEETLLITIGGGI